MLHIVSERLGIIENATECLEFLFALLVGRIKKPTKHLLHIRFRGQYILRNRSGLPELCTLKPRHQINERLELTGVGSLKSIQILDPMIACYHQREEPGLHLELGTLALVRPVHSHPEMDGFE